MTQILNPVILDVRISGGTPRRSCPAQDTQPIIVRQVRLDFPHKFCKRVVYRPLAGI